MHPDDRDLARLREDFPGHRIFRSVRWDGLLGSWCATLHDPAAGIDPTVIEDDPDTLHAALVEQRVRAEARLRTEVW
ncbi:hypothetical protein [Spirillospora sp. NPDC047279]|uniref:hypothetical protein n=1 Tax=Spirillospora sp. NPDC047279 TaxID=3155478 RepID=UPI0033E8A93A